MNFEVANAIRILRERGLRGIIKKCLLYLIFARLLIKNKRMTQKKGIEQLVSFSFTVCSGLIKPLQVKEEIIELLQIIDKKKPKIIVEIGTHVGGNLFLLTQIAPQDAIIVSIDLPGGKFGGGYPIWRIPLFKMFTRDRQKLYLIRADSHDKATQDRVESILKRKEVDLLFIDGDHTYDGVKSDFEAYSSLVKKNGLIGFHDIVPHQRDDACGVDKFWEEIKRKYQYLEIVQDWNQNWAGIGLIEKSKKNQIGKRNY